MLKGNISFQCLRNFSKRRSQQLPANILLLNNNNNNNCVYTNFRTSIRNNHP